MRVRSTSATFSVVSVTPGSAPPFDAAADAAAGAAGSETFGVAVGEKLASDCDPVNRRQPVPRRVERMRLENRVLRQDDRAFHRMLQLANISRPLLRLEESQRLG